MSCLNEEENAVCPSSDDDLVGEQSNVPVAAAAVGGAAEPQSPPEGAGVAAAVRRQPSCGSASPGSRTALGGTAERDPETAWSTQLAGDAAASSDYLDLATVGPPQGSSSPVRLSLGQQLGARGRADGGESEAAPQQGGTSSAGLEGDPNPQLDMVELAGQTLDISGVEELAETASTSDSDECGHPMFETKVKTQDSHYSQEIASRSDCKFHIDQFDSIRQMNPDTPQPLSVSKRISSSAESLQSRGTFDQTQANRAGVKPKTAHFKMDAGTWDNSGKVESQGSDRNLPQPAKHRSGNTAPRTNFTSLSAQQSSHSSKDHLTPKTKPSESGQNKDTKSLSLSSQQFEFKLPPVQQGAIAKPEKAKRQRQRTKPLRCLPGQHTRHHSASRLPTPNESQLSNQLLRSQKQTTDKLSEHFTIVDFISPRRDNIGRNSCASKTRIPSPLKGPDCSNLTRSRMQSQQTALSPGSVTTEQTPKFSDGDTRARFPASSWSFSGANNHPGIILSDEIPTRDLERSQQQEQLPKRLNDPKTKTPDTPEDSAQRVPTPLAVENFQLETISSDHQQLTTCRSSVSGSTQSRTAEAGTQTVPSASVSSPRTASTAPPAFDTQQPNTGNSAPATPNRLREVNVLRRGNWTPRGFYPVPRMVQVPVHPQQPIWPNTCRIPLIYRNPYCFVPGNPRYPFLRGYSNDSWVHFPPANGASVNIPHNFQAPPVTFAAPRIHHTHLRETAWFRPAVVYYTSPADRFWQSLPRARQHHHHHHHHQPQPQPRIVLPESRQATNERVAEWLRQVEVVTGAGGGPAAGGRAASPAAASSADSGVQAASASSQMTAPSAVAEQPRHTGESHTPSARRAGEGPAGLPTSHSQH